jgi:hypothetical protein
MTSSTPTARLLVAVLRAIESCATSAAATTSSTIAAECAVAARDLAAAYATLTADREEPTP